MGAGDFDAGDGDAGLDPVDVSALAAPVEPPLGLAVDGLAKDFIVEDGNYVRAHWVDAAVFRYLRVPKGSIRSAPDAGETVSAIRYIDKKKIQAQVEDSVRLSLKPLLDRKLVTIMAITLDLRAAGKILYAVDYVNNQTAKRDTTPQLNAG